MKRHNAAAVAACILGIILLACLGLYILHSQKNLDARYDSLSVPLESELSALLTEAAAGQDAAQRGAGETLPTAAGNEAAAAETEGSSAPSAGTTGQTGISSGTTEEIPFDAEVLSDAGASYENSAPLPAHSIIFAGDSRTLGLRDAQHKTDREDGDVFVGKVGEGCAWFVAEGMSELGTAITQNPDAPVVMNFGVNDPEEINNYIEAYWEIIRRYPDTSFYILSVNPIDEEFILEEQLVNPAALESINSVSIARLNQRLKEEFGSRYLDSASYLKQTGFTTVDGLHYSAETYLKIHDFVVRALF